jgi:hypothetical protein
MARIPSALVGVAILMATIAAPAAAAAPSNDDPGTATVISSIPYQDTIDTTEATNGPDDAIGCGGPDVTASVWYRYLATDDATLAISVEQSDYLAGINVLVGSPGSFEVLDCFLGGGRVAVSQGTEYWLLVTPPDAESPGGTLVLDIGLAPPPLQIELAVTSATVSPGTGVATIRGTVTCDRTAFIGFDGSLRQRAGRVYIDGFFFGEVECTPSGSAFEAVVDANGRFAGGRASLQMFAYAFEDEGFAELFSVVRLKGSRG